MTWGRGNSITITDKNKETMSVTTIRDEIEKHRRQRSIAGITREERACVRVCVCGGWRAKDGVGEKEPTIRSWGSRVMRDGGGRN